MTNSHGWSCGQNPRNCEECGYEAEDLYGFDAHTWEMHTCTAEDEPFICNFCDNTFVNKRDLMNHKKEKHTKKVKSSWHFSAGICPFGDQKCWFAHGTENDIPLNMNMHAVFVMKFAEASCIYYTTGKRSIRSMFHRVPNLKMESVFMERRIAGLFIMSKKILLKKI
jgi:hypothetical protein